MDEYFIVKGQKTLTGEVVTQGYKNSAGALLAATLLTKEECIIDDLPLIVDIVNIIDVLESLGVEVEWLGKRKVRIKAGKQVKAENMDFEKARRTRISVLFIGALLSRFEEFKIARPGGDKIGLRPISTHLEALKQLGVTYSQENGVYYFERGLIENDHREIVLQEFSVTATENLMLASVLIPGKTVLKGVAAEPQVQDLAKMLNKMGAKIKGAGTHTLEITGVEKLHGVTHKVVPDPLVAGTYIVAGAVTPGTIEVKNVVPEHLTLFLSKLQSMGLNLEITDNSVVVHHCSEPQAVDLQALPYPGFPTDLLPIVVPLITQAKGKVLIHDPLYENRLSYVDELRKMGADIERVDPHRAFVFGPSVLQGAHIQSGDIRAGASLIIAALMAEGETRIEQIHQIDRGYENLEENLQNLGAEIKRVQDNK